MLKKKKIKTDAIKQGDIFAFGIDINRYGFGVVVSKIAAGHISEIYDYFSDQLNIELNDLNKTFYPPLILDTYSLFQKATEGNWAMIGHKNDYQPSKKVNAVKFVWGLKGRFKTTDIFNQDEEISDEDAKKLPRCSPWGDCDVKQYLRKHGVDIKDEAVDDVRSSTVTKVHPFEPFVLDVNDNDDREEEGSLSLSDGEMLKHADLFEKLGRECNGYAWASLARVLVQRNPDTIENAGLDFNPEAGTFVVYGPPGILRKLAAALQKASRDDGLLRELIKASEVD